MGEPEKKVLVFRAPGGDAPPPEAVQALSEIFEADLKSAEVRLHIAFTERPAEELRFRQLQLSKNVAIEFAGIMPARLKDLASQDVELRTYDPGTPLLAHQVEYVDLDSPRHKLVRDQIEPVRSSRLKPIHEMGDSQIAGLRFYVISLHGSTQEPIYGFRLFSQKQELTQSRFFGVVIGGSSFDRLQRRVFLFDGEIHCIAFESHLFVLRKDKFHQMFRLFEKLKKTAAKTLRTFDRMVPVANLSRLLEDCQKSVAMQTKALSISNKTYLKKKSASMADFRRVIEMFGLNVQVVKEKGEQKLLYEPGNRWEFLRLLDDDYLLSDMTGRGYEATGKRRRRIRR